MVKFPGRNKQVAQTAARKQGNHQNHEPQSNSRIISTDHLSPYPKRRSQNYYHIHARLFPFFTKLRLMPLSFGISVIGIPQGISQILPYMVSYVRKTVTCCSPTVTRAPRETIFLLRHSLNNICQPSSRRRYLVTAVGLQPLRWQYRLQPSLRARPL